MQLNILNSFAIMFWLVAPAIAAESPEQILKSFAADYAADPMAISTTFGIEVDGHQWHVVSSVGSDAKTDVELRPGFPALPIFYFRTTAEVLGRIDRNELSGLTAMGAATSDEITPLDVLYTEGYQKPDDYDAMLRPLIFHFWTKGQPETVPLTVEHSRVVHGAPAVVMYYAKDFRSAVYHVPPRLGREMAPTMSVPFPRLLVVMGGSMTGMVGANAFTLATGQMVFLPPNVPAQLWNDSDGPLQFMFLMFGDGA